MSLRFVCQEMPSEHCARLSAIVHTVARTIWTPMFLAILGVSGFSGLLGSTVLAVVFGSAAVAVADSISIAVMSFERLFLQHLAVQQPKLKALAPSVTTKRIITDLCSFRMIMHTSFLGAVALFDCNPNFALSSCNRSVSSLFVLMSAKLSFEDTALSSAPFAVM